MYHIVITFPDGRKGLVIDHAQGPLAVLAGSNPDSWSELLFDTYEEAVLCKVQLRLPIDATAYVEPCHG